MGSDQDYKEMAMFLAGQMNSAKSTLPEQARQSSLFDLVTNKQYASKKSFNKDEELRNSVKDFVNLQ